MYSSTLAPRISSITMIVGTAAEIKWRVNMSQITAVYSSLIKLRLYDATHFSVLIEHASLMTIYSVHCTCCKDRTQIGILQDTYFVSSRAHTSLSSPPYLSTHIHLDLFVNDGMSFEVYLCYVKLKKIELLDLALGPSPRGVWAMQTLQEQGR